MNHNEMAIFNPTFILSIQSIQKMYTLQLNILNQQEYYMVYMYDHTQV